MYTIELDWRPLDIQLEEHTKYITAVENETEPERSADEIRISVLETVFEEDDETVATSPDTDQNELNVHEDGNGESQKALTPKISNGSDERPHSPPSLIDKENSQIVEEKLSSVILTLQGRLVRPYISPQTPIFSTHVTSDRQEFSFFPKGCTDKQRTKNTFKPGDRCNTMYGSGIVSKYRDKDGMYIVDIDGWSAKAYLTEGSLNRGDGSVWNSLLRIITPSDVKSPSKPKRGKEKDIESFDFKDVMIRTPYGEGKIIKHPTMAEKDMVPENKKNTSNKQSVSIALNTWRLADNSHPILYCTEDTLS